MGWAENNGQKSLYCCTSGGALGVAESLKLYILFAGFKPDSDFVYKETTSEENERRESSTLTVHDSLVLHFSAHTFYGLWGLGMATQVTQQMQCSTLMLQLASSSSSSQSSSCLKPLKAFQLPFRRLGDISRVSRPFSRTKFSSRNAITAASIQVCMSTLFTNGFLLNGRERKGARGCTLLVEEFLLRVKGKEE